MFDAHFYLVSASAYSVQQREHIRHAIYVMSVRRMLHLRIVPR